MQWSIASDIDGTLTGDRQALAELKGRLAAFRSSGGFFALVTGRSYGQVLLGLADEGLPIPDAIITQVGTEIYVPPFTYDAQPLAVWREHLQREYRLEEVHAFVDPAAGWSLQPGIANTPLKASWWYRGSGNADQAAAHVRAAVQKSGQPYRVIWSSGRDLDILPAASGKGLAMRFLLQHLGRSLDHCVGAGDTGNDIDMLDGLARAIVVGNAQAELLDHARALSPDRVYIATAHYARGVAEGLDRLGILPSKP